MTYENWVENYIFVSIPTSSTRCKRKLTGYALNILRLCDYPSRHSVEFETIMNGIINSAIVGSEENI